MANTLRIKRRASGSTGAPSSLENAELAFNEVDNILYYGKGTGGAGGSATTVEAIGGPGGFATLGTAQTISGNKTFTGTVDFSGATIATFATSSHVTVGGNLTVNGTTTTVNSTTLNVDDKNLELGSVATPSDSTADGGGLTLKGATDKTLNWVNATDSWTSSEHFDLASGKSYKINGTNVLSGSSLGSGVTGSSLTSVGTVTSGTWNATTIAVANGGTGATTAAGALSNFGLTATASELNKLDGATVTTAEINIVDGSTSATSTTLAQADRMVINDNGTMVQVALSDLVSFLENGSVSGFDVDGGTF
jgi:hypothetical protein